MNQNFIIHDGENAECIKIAEETTVYHVSECFNDSESKGKIPITIIGQFAGLKSQIVHINLTRCKYLTVIDDFAFARCISLKKVKFPSSLKFIKKGAFFSCSSLLKIKFPKKSKLYSIGEIAFKYCTNLKTFICPKYLKTIDDCCFDHCNLQNFIYNDNLEIIGKNALVICQNKFIAPKKLRIMKKQDFSWYFVKKVDIVLPKNIAGLNLKNMAKMSHISFHEDEDKYVVLDYSSNAYSSTGITFLLSQKTKKHVLIRADVEKIFQNAFAHSSIVNITIPESVKEIGRYAFFRCLSLKHVRFRTNSKIEILHKGAFYECEGITSIFIPASLKIIEKYAFLFCKKLEHVKIANNSRLQSIGLKAFGYTSVKRLSLPQSVKDIHPSAFMMMKYLEYMSINNEYYYINDGCLIDRAIKKVIHAVEKKEIKKIPENIEIIGKVCVSDTIQIPSSVRVIDDESFISCKLKDIFFDERSQLESIGFHSFCECSISKLVLPSSIKKIHSEAFCLHRIDQMVVSGNYYQTLEDGTVIGIDPPALVFTKNNHINLTKLRPKIIHSTSMNEQQIDKLIIPNSVEEIGHFAFSSSTFKEVVFEENSRIDKIQCCIFENCGQLTKISFPSSVKIIEGEICLCCDNLIEICFPHDSQLEKINEWAFNGADLDVISFPKKLLPLIVVILINDKTRYELI